MRAGRGRSPPLQTGGEEGGGYGDGKGKRSGNTFVALITQWEAEAGRN